MSNDTIDPAGKEASNHRDVAETPSFGAAFPAKRISTALVWDDLVLAAPVREQIVELENWLRHSRTLMEGWGMANRLRPGYRALFYGAPGTGKKLTAMLLGKATGRDTYRIDLAAVISKYIGETEKNLDALFDEAATNAIGSCSSTRPMRYSASGLQCKDTNDRYANQQISYLLQRIEDFPGLVILASQYPRQSR